MYRSNPQSPYFDNRSRTHQQQQQQLIQENKSEQIYERQSHRNPFLQDVTPQDTPQDNDPQNKNCHTTSEQDRAKDIYNDAYPESRPNNKSNVDPNTYSRNLYGELNPRPNRAVSINERLIERRTPDAYGRSTTMSAYNKGKVGDYEDVYGSYATENEYGKTYAKSPNPSQSRDAISISSQQQPQDFTGNYVS